MAENKEHASARLAYIDIAKAIGLCLVILSHSVCPRLVFFALGCFVPVFFVTSGYTTSSVNLKKKAKRLLIPSIFFNIGFVVLFTIKQIYFRSTQEGIFENIGGILYSRYAVYPLGNENNIFLMQAGNAPLWFLTSMFTAYIALIPLLQWPKMRGGGNLRICDDNMDIKQITDFITMEHGHSFPDGDIYLYRYCLS